MPDVNFLIQIEIQRRDSDSDSRGQQLVASPWETSLSQKPPSHPSTFQDIADTVAASAANLASRPSSDGAENRDQEIAFDFAAHVVVLDDIDVFPVALRLRTATKTRGKLKQYKCKTSQSGFWLILQFFSVNQTLKMKHCPSQKKRTKI